MLFGKPPLLYTAIKKALEQSFLNRTIKNEVIQKFRIKYIIRDILYAAMSSVFWCLRLYSWLKVSQYFGRIWYIQNFD
jgi:hypothetical protein